MSSSEAPSAHAHRPLHAVPRWGSRPGVVLLPRCYYSHVSSHRTEAQRGLCGARPPARSEASLLLGGSGLRLQNVRALAPRAHGAGASPGSRGFAGVRRALGLGRALHPRVGDAGGGQTRRRRPRDRGGRGGSGQSTRQGTPGGQGPAGTEAEAWGGSFLRAPGVGARAPSGLWGRAPSASGGFGPRFVLICCDSQVPGPRSPPLRLRHFGGRGCLAHGGDSGLALCTSPWTLRSAQARAGVLPQAPRP